MPSTPRQWVFLSHSHNDRATAVRLQAVLDRHGAKTYLDQDQIQAGDVLPSKITSGIMACDVLLLLWSATAAESAWVRREWKLALANDKRVVPYRLDRSPFPAPLSSLVSIDASDQQRAHASLLQAVFGGGFNPGRESLFPGQWQADVTIPPFGGARYEINLRVNGQVDGTGTILSDGFLGEMLTAHGMSALLNRAFPADGEWTYEQTQDQLTLTLTSTGFGQSATETIRIIATGRERGSIQGEDLGGRVWTLTRKDTSGSGGTVRSGEPVNAPIGATLKKMFKDRHTRPAVAAMACRGLMMAFAAKHSLEVPTKSEIEAMGDAEILEWIETKIRQAERQGL